MKKLLSKIFRPRVLTTLGVPVVVAAIAWVGGYNFDSRGEGEAAGLTFAVALMWLFWTFPAWDE